MTRASLNSLMDRRETKPNLILSTSLSHQPLILNTSVSHQLLVLTTSLSHQTLILSTTLSHQLLILTTSVFRQPLILSTSHSHQPAILNTSTFSLGLLHRTQHYKLVSQGQHFQCTKSKVQQSPSFLASLNPGLSWLHPTQASMTQNRDIFEP